MPSSELRLIRHKASDGTVRDDQSVDTSSSVTATDTHDWDSACFDGRTYWASLRRVILVTTTHRTRFYRNNPSGTLYQVGDAPSGSTALRKGAKFNKRDLLRMFDATMELMRTRTINFPITYTLDSGGKLGTAFNGRDFKIHDDDANAVEIHRIGSTAYGPVDSFSVGTTSVKALAYNGRSLLAVVQTLLGSLYTLVSLNPLTGQIRWSFNHAPTGISDVVDADWDGRDWLVWYEIKTV